MRSFVQRSSALPPTSPQWDHCPPHPDKRVLSVDAIVGWREAVFGSPSSALTLLCTLRAPGQLWLCPYIASDLQIGHPSEVPRI